MTATPSPDSGDALRRLPRRRILRGRLLFQELKQRGHRKVGTLLVCNYLHMPGDDRVAFIIPKRCGCAVIRNRIRRRLKEAFRHFQSQLVPETVIVWIARQPASEAGFDTLDKEMRHLISQAGLWAENF